MPVISFNFEVWVDDPIPPDSDSTPWWLCKPKDPVEPCPIRTTEFVEFANYDADFKYPLSSSRKPVFVIRPDGCIVCRPTLLDE